jgi:hypothetical protein
VGVAASTRARVRADVVRLAHRGLAMDEFASRVRGTLAKAVPFDGACLSTFDRATLPPTGCAVENGLPPAATLRPYELEARVPDFNAFTALAHGVQPAASLSGATGGDLDRSRRQRELRRPDGFGDELRAALVGTSGTWGAATLLRDASQPHFTRTEVGFVSSVVATPSRCSVPTRRS